MSAEIPIDAILHILEIGSILIGGFTVAYRIGKFTEKVTNSNLAFEKELLESRDDRKAIHIELRKLTEIVAEQNVFNVRLNMLEKWYDELKRGIGFVPHSADGEYSVHGKIKEGGR